MKANEEHIQHWNRAAAEYNRALQDTRTDPKAIYEPAIDELLGDVRGKRILDAGCGEGSYCRKLSSKGALVTGIDSSKDMIAIAMRKSPGHNVDYEMMDLGQRLNLKDRQFDIVLANMVLMDMPRIAVAISEFTRVLRKDGSLLFSIVHPCFFDYEWVSDEKGRKLYKPISDYLNEKVEELNFWGKTLYYHRPLSAYFTALEHNGFSIISLKEPVPSDELLEKHPDWEYHRRIPSFIVAKAILVQ